MNVSPFVKYTTYRIAKGMALYDTGNLKDSITLKNNKSDSWTINYDTQKATYIEPLEEGSKYMTARRFIYATANEIALYLKRELEGKPTKKRHKIASSKAFDDASEEQLVRRNLRRTESILRYEVAKENFKVYDNIEI